MIGRFSIERSAESKTATKVSAPRRRGSKISQLTMKSDFLWSTRARNRSSVSSSRSRRIVGGRRPYKKYQREEKHDVPGIFDQLDQQILCLRHETEQHESDDKSADRNANDPKHEPEIDHVAPGARNVTTYDGPKGARVISYLLPGTWDVGRRRCPPPIRDPQRRSTC